MGSNEDLTVSGNGSLYLQNAGLQAAGSKLKLDGSKVYSSGTVTAKDFERRCRGIRETIKRSRISV